MIGLWAKMNFWNPCFVGITTLSFIMFIIDMVVSVALVIQGHRILAEEM